MEDVEEGIAHSAGRPLPHDDRLPILLAPEVDHIRALGTLLWNWPGGFWKIQMSALWTFHAVGQTGEFVAVQLHRDLHIEGLNPHTSKQLKCVLKQFNDFTCLGSILTSFEGLKLFRILLNFRKE